MATFLTILFFLTAFLLIGVVLIQQPKTAGGLFSGTGQSLLGTSGKTFWTKFTTVLAAVFMCLCLLLAFLPRFETKSSVADLIEKQQKQAAQPLPPAAGASSQAAPNPQSVPLPQKAPNASQAVPAPPAGAAKK